MMPDATATAIACPFCQCAAPDMVEVWRGRGFCASCGRIFPVPAAPNGPPTGQMAGAPPRA